MRVLSRTFGLASGVLVLALILVVAIDQRLVRLDLNSSSRLQLITDPISCATVLFLVAASATPMLVWGMHEPDSGFSPRRLLGSLLGVSVLWAVSSSLMVLIAPALITRRPRPGTLDAQFASDPAVAVVIVVLVVSAANFCLGLGLPALTKTSSRAWQIAAVVGWVLFFGGAMVVLWTANERLVALPLALVGLVVSFAVLIVSARVVRRWRTDLPEELREPIAGQVWSGQVNPVPPLAGPVDQLRLCAGLRAAAEQTPFWVFTHDDEVEVGWRLDDPELARALRLVPGQRVANIQLSIDKRHRVARRGELHLLSVDESGFHSGRREYRGSDTPGWFEVTPAGRDLTRFVDEALARLQVPTVKTHPWTHDVLVWLVLLTVLGGGGYLLAWVLNLFHTH